MDFIRKIYSYSKNNYHQSNSAVSSENFYKKMSTRRSIRSFSSEMIEKDILINAIKTAASAPSGANRQPWYFALITSQNIKNKIKNAAEAVEHDFYTNKAPKSWLEDLKQFGTNSSKPYLSEAPALIAIFSRSIYFSENNEPMKTYYPIESTGIATGFLLTALHNAGLATLTHTPKPMLFLNQLLNLDNTYKPFMIVVTGYPKKPISLPVISRKNIDQIMQEF